MRGQFSADFWRLWSVGLISSIVRWIETVVVGVLVYRETDSPFLVSVVTMLRLLPMGLFGAFLGAFVERFDRRLMLAVMMALLALTSVVLAMIAALGTLQVWHLAVGALLTDIPRMTPRNGANPNIPPGCDEAIGDPRSFRGAPAASTVQTDL